MARYPGRVVPSCLCPCDDITVCQLHTTDYSIRMCKPCSENRCNKTEPVRFARSAIPKPRVFKKVMTADEFLKAIGK